jgi:hypothetical protein
VSEPLADQVLVDSTVPNSQVNLPLECLQEALRGLQFGTVTLIVQDGLVVQVERLDKKRVLRKKLK